MERLLARIADRIFDALRIDRPGPRCEVCGAVARRALILAGPVTRQVPMCSPCLARVSSGLFGPRPGGLV